MKYEFKQFIEDESLGKNKHKSWIRAGWDGRQDQVDYLDDLNKTLRELSIKNFERFEDSRATVVKLEELIVKNEEAVFKADTIQKQNDELLVENKKINKALEKIAGDLAQYTQDLKVKDREIAALNNKLIKRK